MSVTPMHKVQLFTLREDLDRLTGLLQELEIMELAPFPADASQNEAALAGLVADLQRRIDRTDRRLGELGRALAFLDQVAPVRPSLVEQFAGVKTYLTPSAQQRLLSQPERADRVLDELRQIEAELARLQAERHQVQTVHDQLAPWRGWDLDGRALQGTGRVQVFLAAAEAPSPDCLDELELDYYGEIVAADQRGVLFALLAEREHSGQVQAFFAKHDIHLVTLPAYETTVAARLAELEAQRERLDAAAQRLRERARGLHEERQVLQVFYDAGLSEKARLETTRQHLYSERSAALTGWIPADRLEQLQAELDRNQIRYACQTVDPEPGEEPPIRLANRPALAPFEYLVQSFSLPRAGELDPSPVIAPFFFIFFGIALGDAGYGLILSLICAGLLLKLKLGPVGRKLSWMFLLSGLGAVLVGLLTGSVLSLPVRFGIFNPLENPILLLIIALALGLIQLYLGVILSAWEDIRAGRWVDALLNQGFWLLFLTSVVLVLGKDALGLAGQGTLFNYLLLVSALGLVIGNVRSKKGIVAKLLAIPGSFFTFYGGIGFFSDVLSYSRLMALGLSGGVMGGIMNQLAWMVVQSIPVAGWILGAAIFCFGHALNLALSVLGAYVHSSRLQYLEFFGKFYQGGGRPFAPLKAERKYTFVIDEREASS
ncbi:V/A-type H+-transporting ATPase subunit I [Hydrogenispora ethanolica]|uniref:V/A-type H+-transporting ATPase subunit I n=2 Tax=Hydrogenispora ethanolica TaxID=1082276 RepID=A0A4R1SBK4_HYDET|nr:V/A-type H+-transporting ATPase subunit I [Hydrogenispora ethanolica]